MLLERRYNVNLEIEKCWKHMYDILDHLDDIRLALELGEDLTDALSLLPNS